MTSPATLKVDIWSDIACPWCFIGKRKFETAARAFSDDERGVEVEFHSYELSPDTPVDFDGTEIDFLVKHKHMAAAQVEQMLGQVSAIASGVGLAYDFDALQHTNTVKAHELTHFAKSRGRQAAMVERLMHAYFEQGLHVGRIPDLADLAEEVGLDRADAVRALESGEFAQAVKDDQAQTRAYGISGVPFFVIDGKFGVSGAQNPEMFEAALNQAWGERG
ncbi:protein disulfide isomerase FrnE [soil metagenome]